MNISRNSSKACYENESTNLSRDLRFSALLVVGGCGLVGNIFIIVLALKYTARQNLHHLIVNIAVADSLVVLMIWSLEVVGTYNDQIWANIKKYTGDSLCKILSFLLSVGMWLTLATLFAISIERFKATRQTTKRSRSYTVKQRITVLSSCWLTAMVLGSYELYNSTIVHSDGVSYCNYFDPSIVPWYSVICAVCAVIYLMVFVLSVFTLRKLSSGRSNGVGLPETQRKARGKRMASAMRMILCSLFLFSICYLPFQVNNMINIVDHTDERIFQTVCIDFSTFYFMLTFLPLLNSCLSPCVYMFFLSDFRKAAKRLLCKDDTPVEPSHTNTYSKSRDSENNQASVDVEITLRRELKPGIRKKNLMPNGKVHIKKNESWKPSNQ